MDMMMRLAGLALIGLSLLAGWGMEVLMRASAPHDASALEFLAAAISFAAASAGVAMLVCGPKLRERQPVAARWRRYD